MSAWSANCLAETLKELSRSVLAPGPFSSTDRAISIAVYGLAFLYSVPASSASDCQLMLSPLVFHGLLDLFQEVIGSFRVMSELVTDGFDELDYVADLLAELHYGRVELVEPALVDPGQVGRGQLRLSRRLSGLLRLA